ncbi:MAG: carbohydrate binding family 9 domain-containing protein [Pseudomonadales bacterium]|nr:carbohydrate binding family 9 domain-containing protein [Pseudomonadales bacterium]
MTRHGSRPGLVRQAAWLALLVCGQAFAAATIDPAAPDPAATGPLTGEPRTRPAAPAEPPVARAHRLVSSPELDGSVLGDPAWAGMVPASEFWQVRPFEGQPASQRTEVFIGYTEDALYIGVVCYDDLPSGIIVADSRRDSSLDESDSFQVIIDTFRDGQNGFVFGTNPVGIEYDGQVTREGESQNNTAGGGFNLQWDTSWSVRARTGDYGWSAEMRIPFRSLRFNAAETPVWGINFQRNIRRNNEVAYWAPLPRQYNLYRVSRAGRVQGLALPAQRNLQVVPYVLGRAQRGGALTGTEYDREAGVDVKYSLTPSLTLDLTYNTDFAQVEVDDLQVNLDRFNLFFPEKRPFFLENAGQFTVGTPQEVELFFSRRIGIAGNGAPQPIEGGARVSGKAGESTNLGLLRMRTESLDGVAPRNDFTVARINQELPNRSAIGAIVVERKGDGSISGRADNDYNRTYAVDGRLGIGRDGIVRGYVAKSETPGRRGDDHAFSLIGQYNSAAWSNSVGFTEVGRNFNPEVGFLRRRDYQKGEFTILRRIRPDDLMGFHELRPHVVYRGFWGTDGLYESGFIHIDNHWEWRSGLEVHTGLNLVYEYVREPFEIVRGVTVPVGEYDEQEAQLVFITNQGAPLSLNLQSRIGGFFGGDRVNLTPTLRYRWGDAFTSELSWVYNRLDLPVENGDVEINVGRMRLSYSLTPRMLLQALIQYDDRTDLFATNLRFSWLQSANAGLFLVYNEVDDETIIGPMEKRRELALKFSWIFDVL